MNRNDLPRFVELITALAIALGREVDEALLVGYEMGLSDLQIEAIESAVCRALRESRFMPSPAELRELAGEASPADQAVLAFGALSKAIETVGPYRSPNFDDPLINATVRQHGGWERVCELEGDEFNKWFRKEFIATYQALCRAGVDGEMVAPLVGIHERTNAMLGYDPLKYVCDVPTGLPWAGKTPKRLRSVSIDVPRIQLQRP